MHQTFSMSTIFLTGSRRTVSQVKIKNMVRTPNLSPHLDEYSSQKSPPSRRQTFPGFPAPIQSFSLLQSCHSNSRLLFQPPENCIFWAPNQWDMFHFRYECKFQCYMCFLKRNLNLHLF